MAADNATTLRRATRREWRTRSSRNPGIHEHRVRASWADGSWCGWGCGRAGLRPGSRIWTRTGTWGRPWIHLWDGNLQEKASVEIGLKSPHQTDNAQDFNRKLAQLRTRFPNWSTLLQSGKPSRTYGAPHLTRSGYSILSPKKGLRTPRARVRGRHMFSGVKRDWRTFLSSPYAAP